MTYSAVRFFIPLALAAVMLPWSAQASINCFSYAGLIQCDDGFTDTSVNPPSYIDTSATYSQDQQANALYNSQKARYGSSEFSACYQQGKCSSQSGSSNLICARWVESCLSTRAANQQIQQAQQQRVQAELQAMDASFTQTQSQFVLKCAEGYTKTASGCSPVEAIQAVVPVQVQPVYAPAATPPASVVQPVETYRERQESVAEPVTPKASASLTGGMNMVPPENKIWSFVKRIFNPLSWF